MLLTAPGLQPAPLLKNQQPFSCQGTGRSAVQRAAVACSAAPEPAHGSAPFEALFQQTVERRPGSGGRANLDLGVLTLPPSLLVARAANIKGAHASRALCDLSGGMRQHATGNLASRTLQADALQARSSWACPATGAHSDVELDELVADCRRREHAQVGEEQCDVLQAG